MVLESLNPALPMEDYKEREVTLDARAIPHLPGAFVFDERSGIENVGSVRPSSALNPCAVDNIDRESSQAPSPDIVPVGFDGVRKKSQRFNGSHFFGHGAYPFEHASGMRGFPACEAFRPKTSFRNLGIKDSAHRAIAASVAVASPSPVAGREVLAESLLMLNVRYRLPRLSSPHDNAHDIAELLIAAI